MTEIRYGMRERARFIIYLSRALKTSLARIDADHLFYSREIEALMGVIMLWSLGGRDAFFYNVHHSEEIETTLNKIRTGIFRKSVERRILSEITLVRTMHPETWIQ